MSNNRTVTINPPKMCQPIGAIYAYLGVHGCIPLVHGSQGCATYPRYNFCRHFREPAEVATTSLSEDAAVFGGAKNMIEAIKNIKSRIHPQLIGIVTTCLSETIGDDVGNIIKEFDNDNDGIDLIPASTPSYVGTHLTGFDNAVKALVDTLARKGEKSNGKINVITGLINPGDITEIKRLLKMMEVESIFLPDISETLNSPVKHSETHFPKGGTSKEEIIDSANSLGSIALCPVTGGAAAKSLLDKFAVPAVFGPTPIGVKNTDSFVRNVARLSGKKITEEVDRERGLLLDAMVDVHHYLSGKRIAVFGDPDIVAAVISFVAEAGMKPTVACTASSSPTFAQEIKAVAKEYDCEITVLEKSDLYAFHEAVKETDAEVLVGNSKGVDIAKDENIPIVRVGFPVYDRVGYFRYPIMGYHGSIRLLDLITNAILEHDYDDQQLQQ